MFLIILSEAQEAELCLIASTATPSLELGTLTRLHVDLGLESTLLTLTVIGWRSPSFFCQSILKLCFSSRLFQSVAKSKFLDIEQRRRKLPIKLPNKKYWLADQTGLHLLS